MAELKHRRATLILLGTAVFVLLLLLIGLNAFNVRALMPHTTGQIILLTSVSVLVFLLFVTVLVLLLRNLIKLLAEQRSQVLGARLRTRMFIGALLVSLVPALFMFLFSFLLMNRSIDRWFSQPGVDVRDDSTRIATELSHYASLNARAEAESMARSPELSTALTIGRPPGHSHRHAAAPDHPPGWIRGSLHRRYPRGRLPASAKGRTRRVPLLAE